MTGRHRLARPARLCAALATPLLVLAAAPAAAQTVSITSTPANGTHYVAGEAITTRFTIAAGNGLQQGTISSAQMKLDIGGVERRAGITSTYSTGLRQLNFSYTVVADDIDTDGISIPANAIDTMGQTWRTRVQVTFPVINVNNAALADQAAHQVIGSAASISATSPALLHDSNLSGATVTVALTGVTFGSGVTTSSFELVTALTGVSISGVSSVSSGDATATLTLAAQAGIAGPADLAVKVLAAAHTGGLDLTTGAASVALVFSAGPGASVGAASIALEEGATGTWAVFLSESPGASCAGGVLTIAIASDDPAVTVSPATLDFPAATWSTAQTVMATAVEDGDLADETATISHTVQTGCSGSNYATGLSIGSVTVTVNDNDSASITSTTPAALTEANLSGATVTVALTGVTFESGVTTASFELVTTMTGVTIDSISSVSSGDTSATLTLASTADISATADLAVRVLAAAHSGDAALITGTVTVAPALVAGAGASTSTLAVAVREGGMGTWSVVLNADPGSGCTGASSLTIAVASDDTAAVTVSPATLTFTTANWSTAQTVTATGVADNDLADETATVSHTVTSACAPNYPTTLAIASVRVVVEDDDTSLISVDAPRVLEGGVGDTPTLDFTVTLAPAATVEATVDYAHIASGTATSGTDHQALASGTLTFAPGETRKTISVTVIGDAAMESDEGVQLFLSSPTPSTVVIGTGHTYPTGTIVDDDTPTLTIDSPRTTEGDFGTKTLAFTVRLQPAAAAQVTVDWGDVGDGTATSGSDYARLAGGTLTFAAGETRKTIPVAVRGDAAVEPDETVRVGIHSPNPSATPIRDADGALILNVVGVGTIVDDDSLEPNRAPQVVAAPGAVALDVGGTAAISLAGAFLDPDGDPLTLSAASSRPAVATARLNGSTLALTAVAEGQTRITVRAADPNGAAASLAFLVTVGNPASIGGGDADDMETVVVSAPEGGVAEVPIAMAEPREEDVSFAYSFGPDGDPATADADAGDHGGEGGTVTIAAGETEATIRIPILDDDAIEPAREAFAVTLTPTGGAGVAVSTVVVHIAEGVCDRGWQVADALRDGRDCEAVTPAELTRRRTVRLPDAGLELRPLDFLGLGSLTVLILDGNGLSALPEGLLAGSPKLRVLRLRGNRFGALPALGSLPELIELDLAGNLLAELPAEALADLPALGYLYLGGNQIEALPADLLAATEAMRILELQDNALESLPEGVFAGVPKLFSLQLQGNPGAPFPLAVELARVEPEGADEAGDGDAGDAGAGEEPEEVPGRAEIQLRVPHGAPFAIEAAISAPGATLSAAIAAIAAGETLGDPVSVIRDVAGNEANAAVTVEIISATSLPTTACGDEDDEYRCFRGFELRPGGPLTLFEPPAAADVPTMR